MLVSLRKKYPTIMAAPRGAGYWLWKPFIIMDALSNVPDGTPVLYTDASMTFVDDPAPLIALAEKHPVSLFKMSGPMLQATWTKRDTFVEMGADTDHFWTLPQLLGGIQLYRAGPQARGFVSLLAKAMANEVRLTDIPNIHGLPNLPGFVDHRHDQSILTILAEQQAVSIFRDPSQFGDWHSEEAGRSPFRQTFHIHRMRNEPLYKWLSKRLRRKYTGGKGFI